MTDPTEPPESLERRPPAEREAALLRALPSLVRAAQQLPALGERLRGIDAAGLNSRADLARLPVTRKGELLQRQVAIRATDPFGGFSAIGWRSMARSGARRVYQSPGPIYEPEGPAPDYWRSARALRAAGFRAGDLVHNSFSYHLTPGAWIMEAGAHALGCTVFPGGVGNTELQLQAIAELRPDAYCGTPSFLRILVEKAAEAGGSIASIQKALVSGEAFPPSLRDWLIERGIQGYQGYATADAGMIAYETQARQGLVVDEGILLEIVRPGTDDPVPEGEVGEVVVTVFNPDYPLVRLGTGDLSALLPGPCPTGRTNTRIKGWMGRADQTTKVRGMFVHASQVGDIVKRHAGVQRARLVVDGEMANDRMVFQVEHAGPAEALEQALAATIKDITKLRADLVQVMPPGSLPNDGKVIEDARKYD